MVDCNFLIIVTPPCSEDPNPCCIYWNPSIDDKISMFYVFFMIDINFQTPPNIFVCILYIYIQTIILEYIQIILHYDWFYTTCNPLFSQTFAAREKLSAPRTNCHPSSAWTTRRCRRCRWRICQVSPDMGISPRKLVNKPRRCDQEQPMGGLRWFQQGTVCNL